MEQDTFIYGTGTDAPEIGALVPVRICTACGFKYMDEAAEEARHEAVCKYLGILTPRQIVALRMSYGLTRAEFAALTRFGEASLARWETGSILQNAANDQFLYLLHFSPNIQRLRDRAGADTPAVAAAQIAERRFTTIRNIEETRKAAQVFRLHSAAVA
jgi:DNA-binding transcriptional regulator YiaG